ASWSSIGLGWSSQGQTSQGPVECPKKNQKRGQSFARRRVQKRAFCDQARRTGWRIAGFSSLSGCFSLLLLPLILLFFSLLFGSIGTQSVQIAALVSQKLISLDAYRLVGKRTDSCRLLHFSLPFFSLLIVAPKPHYANYARTARQGTEPSINQCVLACNNAGSPAANLGNTGRPQNGSCRAKVNRARNAPPLAGLGGRFSVAQVDEVPSLRVARRPQSSRHSTGGKHEFRMLPQILGRFYLHARTATTIATTSLCGFKASLNPMSLVMGKGACAIRVSCFIFLHLSLSAASFFAPIPKGLGLSKPVSACRLALAKPTAPPAPPAPPAPRDCSLRGRGRYTRLFCCWPPPCAILCRCLVSAVNERAVISSRGKGKRSKRDVAK
ncbi:hypothetical protein DL89DRAFT_116225, partial [Linderina pennispora]